MKYYIISSVLLFLTACDKEQVICCVPPPPDRCSEHFEEVQKHLERIKELKLNTWDDRRYSEELDGMLICSSVTGKDSLAIVQLLINEGADIDAGDKDGRTALIRAVLVGNTGVIKFLINEGADIDAGDKDGRTALMQAVLIGNTRVIKFLINEGRANVDAIDNNGKTALQLVEERLSAERKVSENKQTEIVNLLKK